MRKSIILFFLPILVGSFSPIVGQWQQHTIDPFIDRPAFVEVGDLDGDGDLDAAATSWGDGYVSWYRNNSPEDTWTEFRIDSSMPSIVGLVIKDINGDDTLDIVVAAGGRTDAVIWYENDGGLSVINWTEHYIDSDFDGGNVVYVEDVDGDGDMDVAVTGYTSSTVVWYENEGGIPIAWNKHTIDPYLGGAAGCYIADMDGDDNMDVVATGHDADSVVWYKNNGGLPITWTKMTIDPDLDGANEIDIADMDNDSDLDVVAVGYFADAVVWYENPTWEKHIIDDTLEGAWSVEIADIANDLDILAAGRDGDDVVWYENPTWHKHYIDTNLAAANHIGAADIDKDGALDAILTGWEPTNTVLWYKSIITDVEYESNVVPDEYSLSQNYPNPFNPATTIHFQIPELSLVKLKVYDVLGSNVGTIVNEEKPTGTYEIHWNAEHLPSGVYFYRIQAGSFVETKKMVLMK